MLRLPPSLAGFLHFSSVKCGELASREAADSLQVHSIMPISCKNTGLWREKFYLIEAEKNDSSGKAMGFAGSFVGYVLGALWGP